MKKYITLAALALLCVSCDKNSEVEQPNPDHIRVEACLPTRANLTAFEAGDTIALYAVEYNGENPAQLQPVANYLNYEAVTFDGAKWNTARPLYWSSVACDFYGIYPYQQLSAVKEVLFDIATDQNSPRTESELGGYEASDIMWAKASGVTAADGSVNLNFHHMMSRLVVKVERGATFEGELPEDIVAHIYNTATTAKVDWTIGSLEKYMYSENKTIKMRQVDGSTFDAIVVPQFIERSTPMIEITMEGVSYLLDYSISFRPGIQHTITVTLNTSPDQEKIEISIDGSVDEWN